MYGRSCHNPHYQPQWSGLSRPVQGSLPARVAKNLLYFSSPCHKQYLGTVHGAYLTGVAAADALPA